MSTSACAPPSRFRAWLATVGLLAAGLLGGCVTQDYVHGLGHSASKGALEAAGEGIPALEEPLRQALYRTLVEDDTLRQAASDMAEAAFKTAEARLGSPEMRAQIDDLVARTMESLGRHGDEAIRRMITAAEPELRQALERIVLAAQPALHEAIRKAFAENVDLAAARLRERLDRDIRPATEQLARRTGEELITSLVKGLEGPLQQRLLVAGQEMSQSLIKGLAVGLREPGNQESFGGLTQLMMLQAVRGARQGVHEGLPTERQMALIASVVVLAALLLLTATGLSFIWWRYHQSTKSLTIMAESINQHDADELKAAIQQSAHDNYVGPWLSSFLKRRGL